MKYIISNKRTIFIGIVLFVFVLDFIIRRVVWGHGTGYAYPLIDILRDGFGTFAVRIFSPFFNVATYFKDSNLLQLDSYQYVLTNELGLLKFCYLLLIVFLYPIGIKKTIMMLFIGLSVLLSILLIRLYCFATYSFSVEIIRVFFETLIVYLFIILFFYKLKFNRNLLRIYSVISSRIENLFWLPLKYLLFVITSFSIITEWLLLIVGEYLTVLQVKVTSIVMHFWGCNTHTLGNSIYWDSNYVTVGTPCLGIRLMMLYAMFLIFIKGTKISKWIFIPSGIILIIILNIVRISFMLYHLHRFHNINLTMDLHNIYDITIYTVIFVLWIVYVRWMKYYPV